MSYIEDICDDADSTTTIFSTSSQGSAISIMSKTSSSIAKLKTEIDSHLDDPRREALALVNSLLEQRENAINLLHDISKRPPPEPWEASEAAAIVEEAEEPVETQEPKREELGSISSKEFFRRIRQRLTKKQFKQFVRNMKELNKLREERVELKLQVEDGLTNLVKSIH